MAKNKEENIIPTHSTIALLAPPSAGKRRFCRGISEYTKILHVETGELLRVNQDQDILIKDSLAKGELVDDETVFDLTKKYIQTNFDHHKHHFLFLDGIPRTTDQVEHLFDLAIGKVYILQLRVHDNIVRRRFLNALENDSERQSRPDSSLEVFEKRLRDFRKVESRILYEVSKMGITVFKREINNTDFAAQEFHRIHIAGRSHRNLRPEGAHPHHH